MSIIFDTLAQIQQKKVHFWPGGHLNVTWRGGAHFLRVSTNRSWKKNLHFDTLFRNFLITKQ